MLRDDAKALASKLKKVTLADVIESMEVRAVPFSVSDGNISCIYKLRIKLYKPEVFPPHIAVTLKDIQTALKGIYLKKLISAIENHLAMLSRISGIQDVSKPDQEISENNEDPERSSNHDSTKSDIDEVDDNDGIMDDLGFDGEKERQQVTDEVDYEGSEDEQGEPEESEFTAGNDDAYETGMSGETVADEDDEDATNISGNADGDLNENHDNDAGVNDNETSKDSSSNEKIKEKDTPDHEMIVFVKAKASNFEVHFQMKDKPHILLAQVSISSDSSFILHFNLPRISL